MAKDRRQINQVWDACNRKGEWHTFARVGTGKDAMIVTLHAGGKTRGDVDMIGRVYRRR